MVQRPNVARRCNRLNAGKAPLLALGMADQGGTLSGMLRAPEMDATEERSVFLAKIALYYNGRIIPIVVQRTSCGRSEATNR